MDSLTSLVAESWTWYAVTWVVVVARMVSRTMLRGSIRKLQADDFLILFAMATNTVFIAGVNIVSHTNTNLIDPYGEPVDLTPEDIEERVFGSKIVMIVEQMQILTTWTVKICLLISYGRLTYILHQSLFAKVVAAYVAVGFVVMEILWFGVWCTPFSGYWAVPTPNEQCATYGNHLKTNAVINISSDLMIIAIPFPILWHMSKLSLARKLILCGVFALGFFTIISSILNKYYSFHDPFLPNWLYWYVRESSTALIVANLPCTWTLVQRVFKIRGFYKRDTSQRSDNQKPNSRSNVTSDPSVQGIRDIDLVTWSESRVQINPTAAQLEAEVFDVPSPREYHDLEGNVKVFESRKSSVRTDDSLRWGPEAYAADGLAHGR